MTKIAFLFAIFVLLSSGIATGQNTASKKSANAAVKQARLQKHAATFAWFEPLRPNGIETRQPNANGEIDLSGGMLTDYADVPPGSYVAAPPDDV